MLMKMKYGSKAGEDWKIKFRRARRRLRGILSIQRVVKAERDARQEALQEANILFEKVKAETTIPQSMIDTMKESLKKKLEAEQA